MRIATWNVNSVGARLPRLLDWLQTRQPDVAALQETKCADAGFPFAEVEALGYEVMHVGDGRWNGVAILSRVGLTPLSDGLPGMSEPRYAAAECGGLRVTSVLEPPPSRLNASVAPNFRMMPATSATVSPVRNPGAPSRASSTIRRPPFARPTAVRTAAVLVSSPGRGRPSVRTG